VDPRLDRDLELGADPVGRGDEHGIVEPCRARIEQGAEPAQPSHRSRPVGGARQRLDRIHQRIPASMSTPASR
jgi:hypothetical protein